jgi:hypothetical protein
VAAVHRQGFEMLTSPGTERRVVPSPESFMSFDRAHWMKMGGSSWFRASISEVSTADNVNKPSLKDIPHYRMPHEFWEEHS